MNEEHRSLAELQNKLADLRVYKAKAESDKAPKAVLDLLRQQETLIEQQINTSGGAAIGGDLDNRDGVFVGRDLNIIVARERFARLLEGDDTRIDWRKATDTYLRYLVDRHRYLSLKGMGLSSSVPLRFSLLDMYVPLKCRLELPEGDTWKRGVRLNGRFVSDDEQQQLALVRRLSEPVSILDLLKTHSGLILLGDPGAGKTTFLKYLVLMLASGDGESIGLGDRFPILAPLSAYANSLAEQDVRLDAFISEYFRSIGPDLPIDQMLRRALSQGAALVLLDGLDEVKDLDLRHVVIERVVDFYITHRHAGNKFILASRVTGYRDVRTTAEDLVECTLTDLDDEEIEAFVNRWTAALEQQAYGTTPFAREEAEGERRRLLDVIQRSAEVRSLAGNPLLLTILAVLKRQGVTLPERKVELYDHYVRTLLSSWNRARALYRPAGRDLDLQQTIRILAPLALWMHETHPGMGRVKREDLRRKIEAICEDRGEANPAVSAQRFIEDVHDNAGLLVERGPNEYGFIHLTFEEYLAAIAIALKGQRDVQPIVDHFRGHLDDPAWHEVVLLTVGYLGIIQQRDEAAGAVVEALIEQAQDKLGDVAILAGQSVLELGPAGMPPATAERVLDELIETMQASVVSPLLRRQAGLILGQLNWRPDDLDQLVEILAGRFCYGAESSERAIPYAFWIGKYPVTNAQFARFLADGGYRQPKFWSEAGWRWREEEARTQPKMWDDAEFANPIFPVVNVSWYEAMAYASWLNTQSDLIQLGSVQRPLDPERDLVSLPTEEEWEYAARGADGRLYPWGDTFVAVNANTIESDVERNVGIGTTAVCSYPAGRSPSGAWDMGGNVRHWTLTASLVHGVVRGGYWISLPKNATGTTRFYNLLRGSFNYLGFRVVVVPRSAKR